MAKKILVTGGLGYIGSHTVVALQQEGFEVLIIDDLSNADISFLARIESITNVKPIFYQFDLKDSGQLSSFFDSHKIDGVIHFAASKAVGESVSEPLMYYRNNLISLINLLDQMKKRQLDNFIFSSSCTVYGQADVLPITEKAPLKTPESPYGKTKQMGEEILRDFGLAYHKKIIALRYFNPIGAHCSGKIGELPKGTPNNLIPYITQTAAGIRDKLSVYGSDYNSIDGTAIRDYIYVGDLALAHVLSLKRLLAGENKLNYEVFNLGTGTGSTVLEVIKVFETVNDLALNYEIVGRREGDIEAAYADNTFAFNELKWEPKTPISEALKTAWLWQKNIEQ